MLKNEFIVENISESNRHELIDKIFEGLKSLKILSVTILSIVTTLLVPILAYGSFLTVSEIPVGIERIPFGSTLAMGGMFFVAGLLNIFIILSGDIISLLYVELVKYKLEAGYLPKFILPYIILILSFVITFLFANTFNLLTVIIIIVNLIRVILWIRLIISFKKLKKIADVNAH